MRLLRRARLWAAVGESETALDQFLGPRNVASSQRNPRGPPEEVNSSSDRYIRSFHQRDRFRLHLGPEAADRPERAKRHHEIGLKLGFLSVSQGEQREARVG